MTDFDLAARVRTLTAERDAAIRDRDLYKATAGAAVDRCDVLTAERDAIKAASVRLDGENERLRKALRYAGECSTLEMVRDTVRGMGEHLLYRAGERDAPSSILDDNGEIVLGLCRRCGKGESELSGPCLPSRERAAFVADVRKYLPCLCHDSYKSRGMTDPACPWHVYAVELLTEEEFKG